MQTKNLTLGPTLAVLVGPSCSGKSTFAQEFSPQEVVSADALRMELAGDIRRMDYNDVVFNEFDRRISNRLQLGKRVIADATHIRDSKRRRTAKLAAQYGARVIYIVFNRPLITKLHHAGWRAAVDIDGKDLITRDEDVFRANEKEILAGDGIADVVIDTRKEKPNIILPLARGGADNVLPEQAALIDIYSRGYKGVLVVGDVHGNTEGLSKMIALARSEKLFLLFMGDIIDYGADTLNAADLAGQIVFNGEGAGVLGNHEKKIRNYIARKRVDGVFLKLEPGADPRLSSGNHVTINQLKAMLPEDRLHWETRFFGLCDLLPHTLRLPRYLLVHAAATPSMLARTEFRYNEETKEEVFAMYGQTTGEFIDGYPERLYDWVHEVPPRQTVVVGHDCRREEYPYVATGAAGGRAIFLDTGSSKWDRFANGRLSGMRLDIEYNKKAGFTLQNEKFYTDVDL